MKKAPADKMGDDLRPEYDLSQLKGSVRGKYYRMAVAPAARLKRVRGPAKKRV